MAEITQRLGFDASQAIASLRQLRGELAQVNTQLRLMNQISGQSRGLDAVGNSFANAKDRALEADRRIRDLRRNFQQTGQAGAQAGQQITVSWQTMARVVQTQLIVGALNTLVQGFFEAAAASREFEISVARISNIADGAGSGIEELSQSLLGLSDDIGFSLTDVASAAFEAFQNDLGDTAETLDIVGGAAADLALITGGDLTDSVNTISSVIKIFGDDIENTDRIADILFGTIDAGRVTLDELANSLGSVAPLADTVGVSLEELSAAIAGITLQGVDAARAQTQLRGIFNALLKPTNDLAEAFEQLGVESGRDLIETSGGLVQALQALEGVAAGNEQQFAAFFGRIRGQLGALNILNDGASETTRILGELQTNAGRAAEAVDNINATSARQAEIAFNELNNVVTRLGETANDVLRILAQGAAAAIPNAEALIVVISGVAAALSLAAGSALLLGTSLVAALAPIALVGAAALVFAGLGEQIGALIASVDATNAAFQRQVEAFNEVGEAAERATERATNANDAQAQAIVDSLGRALDFGEERWEQYGDTVESINQAVTDQSIQAVADFGQGIDDIIDAIDDRVNGLDDLFEDFAGRAKNIGQELEDFDFEASIEGQNQFRETIARTERAQNALNDALTQNRDVNPLDEQGIEDARSRLERAVELAREANQVARGTNNTFQRRQGRDLERQALQELKNFEERNAGEVAQRRDELNRASTEQAKNQLEELKGLAEEVAEAERNVGQERQTGTPEQLEQAQELAEQARQAFDDALGDVNVEALDVVGLREIFTSVIDQFQSEINQVEFNFQNAARAMQQALDAGSPFSVAVAISEFGGQATGNQGLDEQLQQAQGAANPAQRIEDTINALNDFRNQQVQATNESAAFTEQVDQQFSNLEGNVQRAFAERDIFSNLVGDGISAFNQLTGNLDAVQQQFADSAVGNIGGRLRSIFEGLSQSGEIQTGALDLQIQEAQAALDQAVLQGELNETQARNLQASIEQARTLQEAAVDENARREIIDPETTQRAIDRLNEIQETGEQLEIEAGAEELLRDLRGASQAAGNTSSALDNTATSAGVAAEQTGVVATNTGEANTQAGNLAQATAGQISVAGQLAQAWANVAAQARAAASAAAAAGGSGFAFHGGPVFRQDGGPLTRGQDKLLTALSPGEFVLNARTSRNLSAQVSALNANQGVGFREQGGPVTNIGDVNVNVTTDNSGGIDGRQVGQDIRRELRRGTLRLS